METNLRQTHEEASYNAKTTVTKEIKNSGGHAHFEQFGSSINHLLLRVEAQNWSQADDS
jgi:hypothetical protein